MIGQQPTQQRSHEADGAEWRDGIAARARPSIGGHAASVGLAIGLLVLWQVVVKLLGVPAWLLPAPTDIVSAMVANAGSLTFHGLVTLSEVLVGFALAFLVGVALAIAIAKVPVLDRALYPYVVASQTIPVIAIAPLLLFWFGYGLWPKAIVVVLISFFPIAVNTVDGFRSVDPELRNLLRTMGASPAQIFTKVELPAALPYLLSGTKVAIAVSVIGAVVGEWVGAQAGLGYYMIRAAAQFHADLVFAAIVVLSALGIGLFGLVALVERVALRYRRAGELG